MIPTSTKLIMLFIKQLQASGKVDFERLQAAVKFANEVAPQTANVGLKPDTHELDMVIQQGIDLGYIDTVFNHYMLTPAGERVLEDT